MAPVLLPTPTQSCTTGSGTAGRDGGLNLQTAAALLPTPAARDAGRGAGWGDQPGRPLSETVHRLLPTPTRQDGESARCATANRKAPKASTSTTGWTLSDVAYVERWGDYAPAIARWERGLGRRAPDPTRRPPPRPVRLGRRGRDGVWLRDDANPQLWPPFVEWMMGVPAGWVTSSEVLGTVVDGMSPVRLTERGTYAGERNAMLSLLGDGVVVPFIAAQVRDLLPLALAEAYALAA